MITIRGERLRMHPHASLFWERTQTLFLADLHWGKADHFRKQGIPVPGAVSDSNWDKLCGLLIDYRPKRLFFLGDLFHSQHNAAWENLLELLQRFPNTECTLVRGNHDILPEPFYEQADLQLVEEGHEMGPFLLTHHPLETSAPKGLYNLAGHLHPGVRLRGSGRQWLRRACFWFRPQGAVLPAFGLFTGLGLVEPQKEDRVFVVGEVEVVGV